MTDRHRPRPGATTPRGQWQRTAAWYRAPGVALLAAGLGVAFGRPDLAALAAPLAIAWVAALLGARHLWGSPTPTATTTVDRAAVGNNRAHMTTTVAGLDGVEYALVAQPGRTTTGPVGRLTAVPGGPQASIDADIDVEDWGATTVARPDTLGVGPDGLYVTGPVRRGPMRDEVILPAVVPIAPLPLPPILGGWAGAHVSRRPGQGSDLVDLREFAPGDRLKSIHWRAYARHAKLFTRRTLSDADAELVICLDLSTLLAPRRPAAPVGTLAAMLARTAERLRRSRDEWAESRGDDRPARRRDDRRRATASSLDLTVSAATAIAAAHLGQGDRVGLITAAVPRRTVRPGTGSRQLQRIRYALAALDDHRHRLLDVSLWGLRPGQIVVFCSPMIPDAAFDAAVTCAARGHRVIVVDTAPLTGLLRRASTADVDHLRVATVERELRFDRLRGRGLDVVCWDRGDLAGQLTVARRAARGRR